MCSELEFLVPPFRSTKLACDEAHPVDAAKVAIHERVPRFGVVIRTVCETEMLLAVFLPRVVFEEGVFVVSAWLTLAPVALQNVLMRVDQPFGACYCARVDRVRSHRFIVPERTMTNPAATVRLLDHAGRAKAPPARRRAIG